MVTTSYRLIFSRCEEAADYANGRADHNEQADTRQDHHPVSARLNVSECRGVSSFARHSTLQVVPLWFTLRLTYSNETRHPPI
jgi:hypothetical protein